MNLSSKPNRAGPRESEKEMKKLMFAATAAFCAAVTFGLESANIVGYQNGTSIQDNNFIAPAFMTVGCNTVDIQDIKIDDGGAGAVGWGAEMFSIWEGAPVVAAGSEFLYCDPSYDPNGEATTYYWGDGDFNKVTYAIPAGQGFVINCVEGYVVTVKCPYSL